MDGMKILQRIVEEDGSCCWSNSEICSFCPISKLIQKPDGSYLSCVDAVNIKNLSEDESDIKYREVAIRLLLDETVEQILKDVNGAE